MRPLTKFTKRAHKPLTLAFIGAKDAEDALHPLVRTRSPRRTIISTRTSRGQFGGD